MLRTIGARWDAGGSAACWAYRGRAGRTVSTTTVLIQSAEHGDYENRYYQIVVFHRPLSAAPADIPARAFGTDELAEENVEDGHAPSPLAEYHRLDERWWGSLPLSDILQSQLRRVRHNNPAVRRACWDDGERAIAGEYYSAILRR